MRTVIKALLCISALAPFTANANLLQNGGFEDFTGTFASQSIVANNPATFGFWIDRVNWNSVVGATSGAPAGWSGSNFARQDPRVGNPTNPNAEDLLMQAFAGSEVSSGATLNLTFQYYRVLGYTPRVVVYGLAAGGSIDQNAPFFTDCVGCTSIYSANLAPSANWTTSSHSFQVLGSYEAIFVGFIFGANMNSGAEPGYQMGLDNVRLVVPEPMTLALFGAGLLGVGLARRRRHHV